jgi:prepilin-type N-terminal cleavage/methylation domain-containing protein/prepilin-type processing-associated H-X9-DG protein
MKRRGFTLVELIVVIFAMLMVVTFVLAVVGKADDRRARVRCASNLRQIGQALLLYSNDNRGPYSRTKYDVTQADHPTMYTGVDVGNPFGSGGPKVNDVSAAIFLLLRTEDVTSSVFICPSSSSKPDNYGGGIHTAVDKSNFPSADFLSYSYANPYPSAAAAGLGYKLVQGISPDFAVAADMNPGGDVLTTLTPGSSISELRKGNSLNHSGDGQNVLYGDGHVEFQNNPLCGTNRDNIYTYGDSGWDAKANTNRSTGGADVLGSPVSPEDSVLLPALNVEQVVSPTEPPAPTIAPNPVPPAMDEGTDFLGWAFWLLIACIVAAIGLAIFAAVQRRNKSRPSEPG